MPTAGDPLVGLVDLPGVADAVAAARAAVDQLRRHRVPRRRGGEVSSECALRGARASADLAGAAMPLEDLRAAVRAGTTLPGAQSGGGGLGSVAGAVRLYGELATLVATFARAPRQALARMHLLAAYGDVAEPQLGRPRPGALEGGEAAMLGLGPPPPPDVVASRLNALVAALAGTTCAPAIVVGAVVHAELLVLRPFVNGNGLVARAADRLVLVARGLDPSSITVPEVGHAELRADYARAIGAYADATAPGVAHWLRHCADAVALGAREGLAVCEAIRRAP